jgi:hypothetical protein
MGVVVEGGERPHLWGARNLLVEMGEDCWRLQVTTQDFPREVWVVEWVVERPVRRQLSGPEGKLLEMEMGNFLHCGIVLHRGQVRRA